MNFKSLNSIKSSLAKIASNHNLTGKSVNLQIDLLAYLIYNHQAETMSAMMEVGLNSSKLINSKIERCLDVMYSVYRGKNPRVIIPVTPITAVNYAPYSLIHLSNKFYVYNQDTLNFNLPYPDLKIDGKGWFFVRGIISDQLIVEKELNFGELQSITYYIDLEVDNHYASNLSEDLWIGYHDPASTVDKSSPDYYMTVNWSRSFIDHLNAKDNEIDDDGSLILNEVLFVTTIQDYGIRIYRRGGFKPNEEWSIKVIPYSDTEFTEAQLNDMSVASCYTLKDEDIDSTEFFSNPDVLNFITQNYDINTSDCDIYEVALKTKLLPRDTDKSLLYKANEESRVGSYVRSNYDVVHLFDEYFRDEVIESSYAMHGKNIIIFYIPTESTLISSKRFNDFLEDRSSYFIGQSSSGDSNFNIDKCLATQREIYISIDLYTKGNVSVFDEVDEIINSYSQKVNTELNFEYIRSTISKLSNVHHVKDLKFLGFVDSYNPEVDLIINYDQELSDEYWYKLIYPRFEGMITEKSHEWIAYKTLIGDPSLTPYKGSKCIYYKFNIKLIQKDAYAIKS